MSSAPLLTVVTITLNDREGFRQTAESLLQQSHLDRVEWLVVDGGSTDGTLEAAYDALVDARAPARARVLEGPDGGIADAMIRGAAAATAEYLQFLNSGDRYHGPAALDRVWRTMDSSSSSDSPAWLYGQCRIVDEEYRPVRPLHARRYTPLRHAYHITQISHQAVFVRRDVFEDVGGFRRKAGTSLDFDLILRLGKVAQPAVFYQVLVDYLEGGHSQTQFKRQIAQAASCRREVLGLRRFYGSMDKLFSFVFAHYGQVKLWIKPWIVHALGERFLRWWGGRRKLGSRSMDAPI